MAGLSIGGLALQSAVVRWPYGTADQALAQIELSANCNSPNYSLCDIVGTGGIRLWVEIDANGNGDIAGAGCGQTVGGAGSIRCEVTRTYSCLEGGATWRPVRGYIRPK